MSREIKFRAWDGEKFIYWPIGHDHTAFAGVIGNYGNRQQPQQYTGLKDKNGQEIYEGDVVKAKHEDGRYDTGSVVYGGKGAFCLYLPHVATGIKTPLLNYIFGIGIAPESDFEVIGNIYENQELLKS